MTLNLSLDIIKVSYKVMVKMRSKKKIKWVVSVVLGLLFLTLPMADACMLEHLSLRHRPDLSHRDTMPCSTLPSSETAKHFCNLSDEHRSLHHVQSFCAPALLSENGLALIDYSLKALSPLSGVFDLSLPQKHPSRALFILHRTLLV